MREELPLITPESVVFLSYGFEKELRASLQEALDKKVAAVRERGGRARALLTTGAAHLEICKAAQHDHADMIVMGSHGRRGLRRLIMGSVADRVTRSATVPVLVVRKDEPG